MCDIVQRLTISLDYALPYNRNLHKLNSVFHILHTFLNHILVDTSTKNSDICSIVSSQFNRYSEQSRNVVVLLLDRHTTLVQEFAFCLGKFISYGVFLSLDYIHLFGLTFVDGFNHLLK